VPKERPKKNAIEAAVVNNSLEVSIASILRILWAGSTFVIDMSTLHFTIHEASEIAFAARAATSCVAPVGQKSMLASTQTCCSAQALSAPTRRRKRPRTVLAVDSAQKLTPL
jgi:hypothetical protein